MFELENRPEEGGIYADFSHSERHCAAVLFELQRHSHFPIIHYAKEIII